MFKIFNGQQGKQFLLSLMFLSLVFLILIAGLSSTAKAQSNVPIGGGGYVTGIVAHPTEADLVYIRTDVAGLFRWNTDDDSWTPLSDAFDYFGKRYYSIESVALDPNSADTLYIAAGEWLNSGEPGSIFRSTDRGNKWIKTALTTEMTGNGDLRWAGERLQVDPANSKVLYFGSRTEGLKRSLDRGDTWETVQNVPFTGDDGSGITFVLVDDSYGTVGSGAQTRSKSIWIGVYRASGSAIFVSSDGGQSWQNSLQEPGFPGDTDLQPMRASLSEWGDLFVSFHSHGNENLGAVYRRLWDHREKRFNWLDITPDGEPQAFTGISVAPDNPLHVIAGSAKTWLSPIYQSFDGGSEWQKIESNYQPQAKWLSEELIGAARSQLIFDPTNSDRVWFTDWFGVWRSDNITQTTVQWDGVADNLENTVVMGLTSPRSGDARLFSGIADIAGFRHESVDGAPSDHPDSQIVTAPPQDITSLAVPDSNTEVVYAVGGFRYKTDGYAIKSTNNGQTFSPMKLPFEGAQNGRIQVNHQQPDNLIWIPEDAAPFRSEDGGNSWSEISDVPTDIIDTVWTWAQPLASDYVWNGTFYIYDYRDGRFYVSYDNGLSWEQPFTFTELAGDKDTHLKAVPGRGGEAWVSAKWKGLWKGGWNFEKIPDVEWAINFGFGKGLNEETPAVYLYGRVKGVNGVFVSYDLGDNWKRFQEWNSAADRDPYVLEGDRRVKGQVLIGTNGRGIVRLKDE